MRICWKGFCATNHSWALVAQHLCRNFIRQGHTTHLFSTNGVKYFPPDLKENLLGFVENNSVYGQKLSNDYDCAISYTAPHNWPHYLNEGKFKLGIWAWEWANHNSLPSGFAKNHIHCDKILPPSQFAKQVFLDSGIPENKMEVISHGIDIEQLNNATPITLNTRKTKILVNLGQIHMRKGLDKTLEAFGKAFDKSDDVCIVFKVSDKTPTQSFELSFKNELQKFKVKFPNSAEVIVLNEFVDNIFSIYKACDIYFNLTRCEGFGLPFLEALACGLVVISPRYGGMLDFLNDDNALLVNGNQVLAPPRALYWEQKANTSWFENSIDDAIDKLKYAVHNVEELKIKALTHSEAVKLNYNWSFPANQIIRLITQ